MSCTPADWVRWLPAALNRAVRVGTDPALRVPVGQGVLDLRWCQASDRVIAGIRLPVLQVRFAFEGVEAAARAAFMQRFDLYMQRGGG